MRTLSAFLAIGLVSVLAALPSRGQPPAPLLPPLPAGVAALEFSDFFVRPVGPRGLELTEKLLSLDGKRVRLLGYMVQQEEPRPGTFLLCERPLLIDEHEGGYADLPPAHVRVLVPTAADRVLPHTPRPLLLTGTLSVGNRREPDGSVSLVRLTLDAPAASSDTPTTTPQ